MRYYAEWRKSQDASSSNRMRAWKEANLWRGKFNEVKNENNELRKQVRRLTKAITK